MYGDDDDDLLSDFLKSEMSIDGDRIIILCVCEETLKLWIFLRMRYHHFFLVVLLLSMVCVDSA